MRILILGAGGIGGYMGGRLVEAGFDVTFLVRLARAAKLKEDGLRVESPLGNLHCEVKTRTVDDPPDAYDAIVLASKAYDLDDSMATIRNSVGETSAIIPFLNGVRHFDRLRASFPIATLLGGVAHISVTLRPDGVVQHMTPLCRFRIGAFESAPSTVPMRLAEAMKTAGIETTLSPTIAQDLWDKFVFLTTLAGINCLMRASLGQILETPAGERLIRQLLAENISVAAAEGFKPSDQALSTYIANLTEQGSPFTASMMRDLERGALTEGDHIVGDMLRRGKTHDLSLPLLEIAATHLQAYDIRRKANA